MRSLIEFEEFWCLKTHSWWKIVNNLATCTCICLFDIWNLKVDKADQIESVTETSNSFAAQFAPPPRYLPPSDMIPVWNYFHLCICTKSDFHIFRLLSFYWNTVPAAAPWIPSLVTHEKKIVCIHSLHAINIRLTYVLIITRCDFTRGTY